jgi:alpha-galactosidase
VWQRRLTQSAPSLHTPLPSLSLYHETIDAATYCNWTVDYIKCDGCQGASRPTINASWILFREGIDLCANTTGRQVVLSVESCGPNNADDCQAWIPSLANLWRTTGDIQATWASVLSNLDQNNELAAIAGPGHWSE